MKQIALTQGQFALVDDCDYEWLSQWKWFATYDNGTNGFYAMRNIQVPDGRTKILMHRVILDAKKGEYVDHEDHSTLNNQRCNLRLTTNQGNAMNQRLSGHNTSGFCGVSWHNGTKKWVARIRVNLKFIHIGLFADKADAIAARRDANLKHGFHPNHGKAMERMPRAKI